MLRVNTIKEGKIAVIKLERFERTDFKQLIDWIDSPKFMLQWGGRTFSYPLTEQQLENYIRSDSLIYRVVLEENDEVIGHINLTIDRINNSGRIGKVLVGERTLKGHGIGQLMVQNVLHIAFDQLKLHRVSLGVFDFNLPAIACYEKAGFVKEGLLREARKVDDEFWNLWEMSILEKEWSDKR
ncbi:GNAT family N-acetyltransferase [Cohnella sp. CFH 77786]|nr:GNAT family protein [Cohnella sp. CFH 77786]MBW5448717.1 GNAT family N-acetyltransferase [Cohnella sp. CFH 77786]